MIDYTVTLTPSGGVVLPGHASALALGYTKNRGVYRLHIDATGEWEGLTIRAFWHVPDGKDPVSSLVADGYVAVPASVTAQPGNGCITFEGSDGTRTVTSADLRYRVAANSGTDDGSLPEPGTPAWQELVGAVHTDATAAEQAKTDAQTAAKQAGASVKKAGQALSDTITAKEDALKAIGDKQTTATQAVDTARDKALQQVEASTEAAQTAASEAATSAGNADQSAQEAAGSLQELKDGIANGNFKGEPGNDGKSPVVTVTDIKNGHRVSITDKDGTKTIDVLNGQAGKDGTQIDDATVGLDAWSSKHIIDTLCPPISETGNPAQFCPVAGYPLGCKVSWEPTQDGSGTPYPAGGGKNLWGDLLQDTFVSQQGFSSGYSGAKTTGKIPCTEGDNYTLSCATTFAPAPGNIGVLAYFDASDTMLTRIANTYQRAFTLTAPANAAYLRASCYSETDADNVQLEKGSAATAYAPYENIRPISGRDSVKVERCGENLLNISPFTKLTQKGITYEYVPDGGIRMSGTALDNSDSPTFSVWHLPPGKYCGPNLGDKTFPSIVVKRNGKNVWIGAGGTFEILAGDVINYWYLYTVSGTTTDKTIYPYIVSGTTAPTTYAPYTGQTATLTLPRTIYGGTVDAVSGESSRTWRTITLTGKESAHIYSIFFYLDLSEDSSFVIEKPADGKTGKSSHYPYAVYTNKCIGFTADGESLTYASNGKYPLSDEGLQEWKSYLAAQYAAGTPVQIAYKMATPEPFTATGVQPIPALPGVNTLLTDADSVAVTGRADPIKRITDLEDAVASMTNT